MSEATSGSDVVSMRLRAEPKDGGSFYELNGVCVNVLVNSSS